MMLRSLLFLEFVALCSAQGPPAAAPAPAPPSADKPPADEEYKESEVCNGKVDTTMCEMAKMLNRSEPAAMNDVKPCTHCNVTGLYTIGLKKDMLVKIYCKDSDDAPMYYMMDMEFKQICVSCCGCKVQSTTVPANKVEGCYKGCWSDPHINTRCMKKVWNGNDMVMMSSKVVTELTKGLIKGECHTPVQDDWVKSCKDVDDSGGFNGLFYGAAQSCFTGKSNEQIQNDQKEKDGGDKECLGQMMTCNQWDKESED